MVARLLTLFAVVVSLVGFIAAVNGSSHWWYFSLIRASYVLFVLAVVASLLSERQESALVVGAELLAAATALAFATVALVKFYNPPAYPFGSPAGGLGNAYLWANEAQLFAVAALAFGLTLARRRTTAGLVGLGMAIVMAVGCSIYAIWEKEGASAEVWWWIATVGAFLAAAAAAGLQRDGSVAVSTPVASSAGGDLTPGAP